MIITRCDTIVQCPHGEDEEGCHISETARLVMSLFLDILLFWCFSHVYHALYICSISIAIRGERIIRYSNNNSNIIRITNIHIRIRPQIETRILFVFIFVQKFGSEYYSCSYSSKNLGPNIICIRTRPKLLVRILFVFVLVQKFGSEYHSY